jgi:hypothetical protein
MIVHGFHRAIVALGIGLLVGGSAIRSASAGDPGSAIHDLATSPDFRVRTSAAIAVGAIRPPGAREALEHALGDAQPGVRVAAAQALSALGDVAAIPGIEQHLAGEALPSVKAQFRATLDQLRAGPAPARPAPSAAPAAPAPPADPAPAVRVPTDARLAVSLGTMRNVSGVRGDELKKVFTAAARSRARVLRGVAFLGSDASLKEATARHIKVLTLDGSIAQLTESSADGSVTVRARVEFMVRQEQTIKATLSGAATTFGSGSSMSDESRRRLQDDAVEGAVQSALRGAEQGLVVAAR